MTEYEITALCTECDTITVWAVVEVREARHLLDDLNRFVTHHDLVARMQCKGCGRKVANRSPYVPPE